jgi:hypothetical protein
MKLRTSVAILALYALATAAYAGPFRTEEKERVEPGAQAPASAPQKRSVRPDAFIAVGGDEGWRLVQHDYVRSNGEWVHSERCDHAVRVTPRAPTSDEIEAARKLSPGS